MKLKSVIVLGLTHAFVGLFGFALGIYMLPILIAPEAPNASEISKVVASEKYVGEFARDLKDSDNFHWGEGRVSLSPTSIALEGSLAPGPDYKLYLSPQFVETEDDFNRLKSTMLRVGEVKTFDNFVVPLSPGIDLAEFNTVIVWCETFGEFITAAKYR